MLHASIVVATPNRAKIDNNAEGRRKMGAGDNGTVDNSANRAGNAYHGGASGSADNSAQTEFAKTLNQENDSSQVHGGGTKTRTVDNQMMGILNNPRLSEDAKVAELQKAIANLPDSEKKDLYERLKDRKSHDPLAQQFHYRLSHHPDKAGGVSTTDQVLNTLKAAGSKSQAPADALARDRILSRDATGLKSGEVINAKVTTKEDITNPKAEMTFDFSKQITKDQAAAILFQHGKVPENATLTQGKGNEWIVQYPNSIDANRNVTSHMNSHTETMVTRSKLPGEMFYAEPNRTYSWVGEAKAFNTTKEGPPRRDLKTDMGFVISKRY